MLNSKSKLITVVACVVLLSVIVWVGIYIYNATISMRGSTESLVDTSSDTPLEVAKVDESSHESAVAQNERCDFPLDATRGSYGVVVRVPDSNIVTARNAMVEVLKSKEGALSSSGENKEYDAQAGLILVASMYGTVPVSNIDSFIAEVRKSVGTVASLGYAENEYYTVTDSASLKHECENYLGYLRDQIEKESVLTKRLERSETLSVDDIAIITTMLSDTRNQITSYQSSIQWMWNSLNKVDVSINFKRIPG